MTTAKAVKNVPPHPMDALLRTERIPHIWCPGCGIGTVFSAVLAAIKNTGWDPNTIAMVSGIGCTGRMAGYIRLDSFHTTHGRAIPFATGLKLANPKLKLVVVSGDGDLFAIGGNHFIHAARRNMDMTVLCVNNFTYGMTGGQVTPTTPLDAIASTTPYGNFEDPFNLPHLAESSGAVYVARWTTLHVRQAVKSIRDAIRKKGFSFVEILSPCPTLYGRRNRLGDGLEMMRQFKEKSVVRSGADTREAGLDFKGGILCGTFIDRERPTFLDRYNETMAERLGHAFTPYGGVL